MVNQEKLKEVGSGVLVWSGFLLLLFILDKCNNSDYITDTDDYRYDHIRQMNGIDTVWSKDSAYVIHFVIDSSYYDPDSTDDDEGEDHDDYDSYP